MLLKLFTHYCEITDMNYYGGKGSQKQTFQHSLECDSTLGLSSNNETQSEKFKNVFVIISKEEDVILPIVDIHSHLLPGLDDGVQSFEEAEAIIIRFQQLGYKKLITTPHVMSDFPFHCNVFYPLTLSMNSIPGRIMPGLPRAPDTSVAWRSYRVAASEPTPRPVGEPIHIPAITGAVSPEFHLVPIL